MPVKIKKKLKALAVSENAKPQFLRNVSKFIKAAILDVISKGLSPVNQRKGEGNKNSSGKSRFGQYSESYKRQMGTRAAPNKKPRPVNLNLTGKMLKSLSVTRDRDKVTVWFKDDKAKYHDKEGAGKSKIIRRLLPTGKGEEFSSLIQKKIIEALKNAIKQSQK